MLDSPRTNGRRGKLLLLLSVLRRTDVKVLCCAVLCCIVLSSECSGRCQSVPENSREHMGWMTVAVLLSEALCTV